MPEVVFDTQFIARSFYHFSKIDSTNRFAKQLIANNTPSHGTAILADFQSNGQGQAASLWQSAPGKNILCSIILFPKNNSLEKQVLFNQAIAISIVKTIEYFINNKRMNIQIKWPNDILIGREKCCGILIENSVRNNQIRSIVLGLGLNVNQIYFPENLPNATSLRQVSGNVFKIHTVLNQLFQNIEAYLRYFNEKNEHLIKETYFSYLFQYQKKAPYRIHDREVVGEIIGLNEYGQIKILINNKVEYFSVKQIKFL